MTWWQWVTVGSNNVTWYVDNVRRKRMLEERNRNGKESNERWKNDRNGSSWDEEKRVEFEHFSICTLTQQEKGWHNTQGVLEGMLGCMWVYVGWLC